MNPPVPTIHPDGPEVRQLIDSFSAATGIAYRVRSYLMTLQASQFLSAGYTVADMETVVAWTIRQRSKGTAHGLGWRNVFGAVGEDFTAFAERLAEATRTVRTRPAEKLQGVTRNVGNGHTVTVLDCVAPADATPVDRAMLDAQMEDLKKWAKGGAA